MRRWPMIATYFSLCLKISSVTEQFCWKPPDLYLFYLSYSSASEILSGRKTISRRSNKDKWIMVIFSEHIWLLMEKKSHPVSFLCRIFNTDYRHTSIFSWFNNDNLWFRSYFFVVFLAWRINFFIFITFFFI